MHVVPIDRLPRPGRAHEFVGDDQAGASVSLLFFEGEPGARVSLHRHPYDETFIVEQGTARFFTDATSREVGPGEVVVVAAQTPHGFENVGEEPLRQIDIHPHRHFVTEWLE